MVQALMSILTGCGGALQSLQDQDGFSQLITDQQVRSSNRWRGIFKDLAEAFELRRELGLSSDGLDASISDGNGTGEAASRSRRIVKALRPECEASGNRKVAGTLVTCDMYDMGSQLRGAQCAGAAR